MKMHRYTLEEAQQMARRDKRRVIVFAVGAVLIGAAYFLSPTFTAGTAPVSMVPPAPAPPELPIAPLPFEDEAVLAKVQDGTPEARLALDVEALVPTFAYARKQTEQLLRALGLRALDGARAAELAAAPDAHRLEAFRARGEVLDLERRRREGGTADDWLVTLRSGDGVIAHALFAMPPVHAAGIDDTVEVGDYLRMDGLFFKLYRRQVAGQLVEGPLLLGYRPVRSFAPIDAGTARAAPALAEVQDDALGQLHPRPEAALWQLMARAQQLGAETDWASAPEVDQALLGRIFEDGDTHRGIAVRFPVSRNMGTLSEPAPENPLGVDRWTFGWIGNVMWRAPVGVVQWIAPFDMPNLAAWDDPQQAQFVEARGWFLRNEVYEKVGGEPGRAPLFVLADIRPFVPPPDKVTGVILMFVFGLTALVVLSIFLLLRSDKKKSQELQEALVQRRRARRQRATLAGATQP